MRDKSGEFVEVYIICCHKELEYHSLKTISQLEGGAESFQGMPACVQGVMLYVMERRPFHSRCPNQSPIEKDFISKKYPMSTPQVLKNH
jgi:hypothetical protein